ncbi:MAG: DUF2191 domain-containing protein [Actinomycetota bacterium]|nr:DUF2191 domain-containing protein [Actinomycetota bacterium]
MKITALISDKLISELRKYAGGKTLTDSLETAIKEWVDLKRIRELNEYIKESPLEFSPDYSSEKIREINRK